MLSMYKEQTVVLYSVVTGDYDSYIRDANPLRLMSILDGAYVVTDSDVIEKDAFSKGWTVIRVPRQTNSCLHQRDLKWLQEYHEDLGILSKFDIVVYADGKCGLSSVKVLEQALCHIDTHDYICFDHPCRNNVNDELKIVTRDKLITKESCDTIKSLFTENSFKDDIGLTDTACSIRRTHTNEKFCRDMVQYMRFTKSKRDQAFFMYVLWKNNVCYKKLSRSMTPFVHKGAHHDPQRTRGVAMV